MCDRCREIEEKVAHYRQLAAHMSDRQTLDGIQHIINKLEQEKATLHPPQSQRSRAIGENYCDKPLAFPHLHPVAPRLFT